MITGQPFATEDDPPSALLGILDVRNTAIEDAFMAEGSDIGRLVGAWQDVKLASRLHKGVDELVVNSLVDIDSVDSVAILPRVIERVLD